VFVDGVKTVTLRGSTIAAEFKRLVEAYVEKRFGGRGLAAE
jgi:(E)-4-hydroxy-3-methylbut-2-enyl-diphosphate synthase